ncbi:MAG: hypothetical protein KIT14_17150 [bacterium]|nr:hypothetical protein [bacterium]
MGGRSGARRAARSRPGWNAALRAAARAGQLRCGLEGAETRLAAERAGLGPDPAPRVSRLLVCSNDGAERFYRTVERLVRTHAPRVLALVVDADAAALGSACFGREATARAVLVEHRDAVAAALFALATPAPPA